MKTTRILFAAFALLLSVILPLHANDAALKQFESEVDALDKYVTEQEEAMKDNPMGGLVLIRSVVEKIKLVKTDALPADLKEGWAGFAKAMGKFGDLFNGWPEKAADVEAFVAKKIEADPKFAEELETKIAAIDKELEPAIAKLDELGKKYGLENIGSQAAGK